MSRLRWFDVQPSVQLISAFASSIGSLRYDTEADDGFVAETVSKNGVEATFVERLPVEEQIVDPFGNAVVYKRVEYRKVAFTLVPDFPHLCVRDAPRSLKNFLLRLGQIASHDISVEPIRLDVLATIERLERTLGGGKVVHLTVDGFPLSASASAEVSISGTEDVREDARRFLRNKFARVSSATFVWDRRGKSGTCDVSVGGVFFESESGFERTLRGALVASS